ncbi:hypothetical protein [Lederbergia citri]|uniref:Uncharacterized protein n=1 Tax=Lederbergia citri TaxID=2833580 RepID=A0A942TCU7_9BACI|nr:hypothetical protein [Lederbergia citri]MBS4195383.1 hypothetical protein [Lederbergia citri]
MNLKDLPDEIKVRAFNLIVEKYGKDSNLSEFGKEVQAILISLKELFK